VNLLDSSKADGRATGLGAGRVVVVVRYSKGFILPGVTVVMTDKGCLAMLFDRQVAKNKWTNIVQVRPGNGHVCRPMSDIEESIVLDQVRFKSIPDPVLLT
jgi:hypothetical protein